MTDSLDLETLTVRTTNGPLCTKVLITPDEIPSFSNHETNILHPECDGSRYVIGIVKRRCANRLTPFTPMQQDRTQSKTKENAYMISVLIY